MRKNILSASIGIALLAMTAPVFAENIEHSNIDNGTIKTTTSKDNASETDKKADQKTNKKNDKETKKEVETSTNKNVQTKIETKNETPENNKEVTSEKQDVSFIPTYTGILERERIQKNEELESLKSELEEIDGKLHDYDKKASEFNEKIFNAKNELKEAEKQREKQEEEMKLRIQYMYEQSSDSLLYSFVSNSSMADALNEVSYYQDIYDYDREQLEEYEATFNRIKDLNQSLENDLKEIEKLKQETTKEQERLKKLIEEKKESISLINTNMDYALQSQVLSGGISADSKALLDIATKAQEEALKNGTATQLQVDVARNAGNGKSTFPLLYNWCAAWVSGVYDETGITPPHGNAIDYWTKWQSTGSRNPDEIPIGAAVISSGHPVYGHIGIYLGGGVVVSNLGYLKIETIESFGSTTNVCQGYQGFVGWVWPNNNDLSK